MSLPDPDAVVCGDAFVDDSDREEEREVDPYAPAESIRHRIGDDIDWCDVGGGAVVAVLRRDDSTRGAAANPKSAARRSVQQAQTAPRSSMSGPRKVVPVVIGGLPPAAAGKVRCSPCRLAGGRARVFAAGEPRQASPRLKEPGSPKVSCLGAVRPEQRSVAHGVMSRRSWRAWFAARVTCCFPSHRRAGRAPARSLADD